MELLDIEAEQFDFINIQQYPIFLQKAGGCGTVLPAQSTITALDHQTSAASARSLPVSPN